MNKDILSSITIINKNIENASVKTIRYNSIGQTDKKLPRKFAEDSTPCLINITGTPDSENKSYKIKINRSGKLYNPLNDDNSYGLNKIDKNTKDPLFRFITVSDKCFNLYVEFLKTKQTSYLINAEREI